MFDKFWTALSEELAGNWKSFLFSPAGAFLALGLLAWIDKYGWQSLELFAQSATIGQMLGILIVVIFFLIIAKMIGSRLAQSLLYFLIGDWPSFFARLRSRQVIQHLKRRKKLKNRWSELARQIAAGQATTLEEYATLDTKLSNDYPVEAKHFMPTRLGNIIRAAEEYPLHRYSLEINTVWTRFWLVISDQTRQELVTARRELNARVEVLLWSLLLLIWLIWAWWVAVVWIIASVLAYFSLFDIAYIYGQLLRAAFDLERFKLYEALRWKLPDNPDEEQKMGATLSQFLRRGIIATDFNYVSKSKD